jgi:VanZ family protein
MRPVYLAMGWGLVAVIIWASVTHNPPQISVQHGDKIGHLLAYAGVMFWFSQLYLHTRTRLAYAAGFVALGIALEFVQRALGYRSFEVLDMVADAVGVLGGWAIALATPRLLK